MEGTWGGHLHTQNSMEQNSVRPGTQHLIHLIKYLQGWRFQHLGGTCPLFKNLYN